MPTNMLAWKHKVTVPTSLDGPMLPPMPTLPLDTNIIAAWESNILVIRGMTNKPYVPPRAPVIKGTSFVAGMPMTPHIIEQASTDLVNWRDVYDCAVDDLTHTNLESEYHQRMFYRIVWADTNCVVISTN